MEIQIPESKFTPLTMINVIIFQNIHHFSLQTLLFDGLSMAINM